jgi:hypothetical protein
MSSSYRISPTDHREKGGAVMRKANLRTETSAMSVIERWFDAFVNRDIGGVMVCFATEPDLVVIATISYDRRARNTGHDLLEDAIWSLDSP